MLRSLKYVRRFNAGCGRLGTCSSSALIRLHRAKTTTTLTASLRPRIDSSVAYCLQQDRRNYVTKAAFRRESELVGNADDMLREIDNKVKRYGYLFKPDLDNVFEAIKKKGVMTSTQTLLMTRCCGYFMVRESPETRQAYVNKIWELASSLNVPMDVSHYNALLLVYLDNDTNFSPLEILVDMKNKNISPNRVTFQRLIEQYCKKGDIAGATKILEHMSEHDIPLNEIIFNSLIIGHSTAGDVDNALKMLDIMNQTNVTPSSKTYSAIMSVHAKQGDMESIKSVLNQCSQKDISFTDKDILDVIYTLAVNKHGDLVEEMISYIEKGSNYNRNALSSTCKLLDKHEYDAAYKLQKSLVRISNNYSDEYKSDGQLFLKKLIFNANDVNIIEKYCSLMVDENVNTLAYESAIYNIYKNNLHHLAPPLLKAMKTKGREVREHYFYPLFCSYRKTNNLQGILNTIKLMNTDFGLSPMVLTVKEYVIPYMVENPVKNLSILLSNNTSYSIAANAIFINLLENNKTFQAMKFLTDTQMICRLNLIEKPLINSFLHTKDSNNLVNILHYISFIKSKKIEEKNDDQQDEDSRDLYNSHTFVNNIISQIVDGLQSYDIEVISQTLQGLLEKGIGIEEITANKIKKLLKEKITSEIENNLAQLTSETLSLVPLKRNPVSKELNIPRSKSRNINFLETKAENSVEHKMLLIQEYSKLMNYEAVDKLLKELDEQNTKYTVGFCASLVDFYSKNEKVEEAEKWFKRMLEIDPNCKLDKAKIINFANVLIKSDRWEEALKTLEYPVLDENINRERMCERLLISVSKCCPDKLELFFNKLKDFKLFSEVTSVMLSPVIRQYVHVGDMKTALEKFKWACETYNVTPFKSGLVRKLIEDEDADNLQNVTELCTRIYGESNALFDLAVGFIELDKFKQARKILETPGVRVKNERIINLGKSFVDSRASNKLENLIKIVNGLRYDMNPLYNMLMELYESENNWEKGLALWTQMQEDNIQPNNKFMNLLENILRTNNQEIPFARSKETQLVDSSVQNFRTALENGQAIEAKQLLEKIPANMRSNYLLELVDHYLDVENVDSALESLKEFWNMKHNSKSPFQNTVSAVLTKLKNSNDFQNTFQIMMDAKNFCQKKKLPFNLTYKLNKLYYESNKYEDLWNYIEESLKNQTQAENVILLMFHTATAVQYAFDKPEIEERLKNFAFKAMEYNIFTPINALWVYKFLKNSPDTESFFENHLNNRFYSINAIYACNEIRALNRFPQLSAIVMNSSLKYDQKRKNASLLLRLLLDSDVPNKHNIALECLSNIVKVIPFNTINKDIIETIQKNCEDTEAFQKLRTENSKSREKGVVSN